MAISYTINAEIIDVTVDIPKEEDIFLVDTNVWYWMTYPRHTLPSGHYQTTHYPAYISNAIGNSSKLIRCGLSLAELSHIIEQNEKNLFAADPTNTASASLTLKQFRHHHRSERANVASYIEASWEQVKSMAGPLPNVVIDDPNTDSAVSLFSTHTLDGYDLFMYEASKKTGITKIITDDGDFSTIAGLQVFTANHNLVAAARSQGKLLTR